MAEIDWSAIKTEYVTTDISQSKLAEKYGVRRATLCKHCNDEGWVKQREQYRTDACTKAYKKTVNSEADRLAKLINATRKMVDVAMGALDDEQQFNRYIVTENVGGGATQTEERIFTKVDTKALKELTSVIKDLTGLMREFYNIPTPAQAEAQRIAAERFALEKHKAEEAERQDKTIEIVMSDELEEFCK